MEGPSVRGAFGVSPGTAFLAPVAEHTAGADAFVLLLPGSLSVGGRSSHREEPHAENCGYWGAP